MIKNLVHKVYKTSIKIMKKTSKAINRQSIAKITKKVNFLFFKAINLTVKISTFK